MISACGIARGDEGGLGPLPIAFARMGHAKAALGLSKFCRLGAGNPVAGLLDCFISARIKHGLARLDRGRERQRRGKRARFAVPAGHPRLADGNVGPRVDNSAGADLDKQGKQGKQKRHLGLSSERATQLGNRAQQQRNVLRTREAMVAVLDQLHLHIG